MGRSRATDDRGPDAFRPDHTNAQATVAALRTAWNDAARDGLIDENPFSSLGLERRRGRADIVPLTLEEVHRLAEIATEFYGTDAFGQEVSAAIIWAAYTMCRPGETFAARHSLLHGDEYHLRIQMNSLLGKETFPKHDSIGVIYVPQPAVEAVQRLPRRVDEDLIFHSKRGKQLRRESWWRTWDPIRTQFVRELPDEHHLRERLAIDPRKKLDFYELRHMGASYALNVLGIEPWVIAKQLRHSADGALVIKLYGHPTRRAVMERMRRGWGGNVRQLRGADPAGRALRLVRDEPRPGSAPSRHAPFDAGATQACRRYWLADSAATGSGRPSVGTESEKAVRNHHQCHE